MYEGTLKTGYGETGKLAGSLSTGQEAVFEFIRRSVRDLGAPTGISGPEALEALRVAEGYEGLPTTCPLGSYEPALVSLPSGEVNPVSLASLWGSDGQKIVETFTHSRVHGPAEAQARLIECGVERVYQDPKLNNTKMYAHFLHRLHSLNLIEFTTEAPTETVGLFFVKKKQGKLRLIMDCRRSNAWFCEPEKVSLATGDALGRLEIPEGCELHMASADLANAFYTLELPTDLRQFFGLRGVSAKQLRQAGIESSEWGAKTWVYPRVRVVPMGWAWALWWCQTISERICEQNGLDEGSRLRDGDPVPRGNFWHLQYVDNLHVIGTDKGEVERRFWAAVEGLRAAGLTVHEIEVGEGASQILGWELSHSGYLRPTQKRMWRLRMAIREIVKRGRASGQQLERLVGHMTFVSLCKREALSCFGEIYTFIKQHYMHVSPLWKSVRSELLKWDGILPLVYCNLHASWSDDIYAVDASEWGLGVVQSKGTWQNHQFLGSYIERWRFKDSEAKDPRNYLMVLDEATGEVLQHSREESGVVFDIPSKQFKTVGFETVNKHWQVVVRHQWKRADSMPVYEARATLFALRHHFRSLRNYGTKLVVLTDSMTAAVSYDRGRANGFRLRRVLQQSAALLLATGSSLRTRWVPSEWNPADAVSRGLWAPSVPKREFWKDDTPTIGDPGRMGQQEAKVKQNSQATEECCNSCDACKRGPFDLGHRDGGWKPAKQEASSGGTAAAGETTAANSDPPAKFCEQENLAEIPADVGGFSTVVSAEAHREHASQGDRSGAHVLPRIFVPGGRGHEHCQLRNSGPSVFSPQVQEFVQLTQGTAVHEGVAKIVPSKKSHARSIRSHLSFSSTCNEIGVPSDSPGSHACTCAPAKLSG